MASPRTPGRPEPERCALHGPAAAGRLRPVGRVPRQRSDGRWTAAALAANPAAQALGCALAACWAAAFPLFSDLPSQALWGSCAAPAYALAGLLCAVLPRRPAPRAAAAVALAGAVVLPLALLAAHGLRQSEVMVVERSAQLLVAGAAPYLPHPAVPADYDPYLPAMALFGLPRAVLGTGSAAARLLGDARVWFALSFLGCMLASWRLLRPGRERAPLLPLAVLTASPLIALALTVGGVDLPLIGVCCLAMALAARRRTLAAGLVLALACSLKWTAWPALPVAALLVWRLYGRRTAARTAGVAVAAAGAVVLPFVLAAGGRMREQVVRFPLGLAAVRTPAGSPLPGKVLADLGPTGHTVSLVLMCLGGLVVAVWLVARPPGSAVAACDLLAAGLTVAFVLAPAGRFGYLALPTVLALWPRLAARSIGRRPPRPTPLPAPGLVQV